MHEVSSKEGRMAKTETRSNHSREHLEEVISELVVNGSIELSAENRDVIPDASRLLPFGTAIYIPKMLKRPLEDNLERISAVQAAGFDPVPHIAARQVVSEQALRSFLKHAVGESGVHRVMLIGGDNPQVQGPYADGAAVLRSEVLADAGIHEVDVAGYPEGHPRIPLETLAADLDDKWALTQAQGLGMNIVTQFSFVPARIVEYCDELAHRMPEVPVYVGLAGPTDALSLLRYARHCGVSESLRALSSLGVKAAKLACHTSPDEQVEVLARYCAGHEASNVIGIHVFSFGGFVASAEWMRAQVRHN